MLCIIGIPLVSTSTASAVDVDDGVSIAGLKYGESVKSTIVKRETRVITTIPQGQLPGGYKLPKESSVSVNPNAGGSMSFSVSVAWGVFTIGTSVGYVQGGVSSITIALPNPNYYYRVKLRRTYEIRRVKNDHYEYGVYKYTQYATHNIPISVDGVAVRA